MPCAAPGGRFRAGRPGGPGGPTGREFSPTRQSSGPCPNIRQAPLEAMGRLGSTGSVSNHDQEAAMKTVSGEDPELIQTHLLRLVGQQRRIDGGWPPRKGRPSRRSWPARLTWRCSTHACRRAAACECWNGSTRPAAAHPQSPFKPANAPSFTTSVTRRGLRTGRQGPRPPNRHTAGVPLSSPAKRSLRPGRRNPCRTARCRGRSSGRRPTRTGSAGRPSHKSPSRSAGGWHSTSPR